MKLTSILFLLSIVSLQNVAYAASEKKNMERKVAQEVMVLVEDVVYKLDKIDDGYKVLFQTHAGVYYLKKNTKNFQTIFQALEGSKNNASTITLKAEATSLEIKEMTVKAD